MVGVHLVDGDEAHAAVGRGLDRDDARPHRRRVGIVEPPERVERRWRPRHPAPPATGSASTTVSLSPSVPAGRDDGGLMQRAVGQAEEHERRRPSPGSTSRLRVTRPAVPPARRPAMPPSISECVIWTTSPRAIDSPSAAISHPKRRRW